MKKHKNVAQVIIKIVSFLIIGIILLYIATSVLIPKWISEKDNRMSYIMKGFYQEPKNSLDVVFMGNSDVYRGISPITLWDEYGIASYNYVSAGQRMWTAYYMLVECLNYQTPKLIVLNMDSAFNESQSSESNYRKVFDNMKFSKNKIDAITDPVYKNSKMKMLGYFFPIYRYHARWSELIDEDFTEAFKNEKFAYKGLDMTVATKAYDEKNNYMERDHSKEKIGEKCTKYLNKIVKLCKEKNIKLLLMEVPSADSWSKDLSDKTMEFAKNNELEFIDLNLYTRELGLDWKKDTADAGDHLNVYGAEKVSKYLGKIIQEKYDIPNRKEDPNYASWYEDSKIYHEDKEKLENVARYNSKSHLNIVSAYGDDEAYHPKVVAFKEKWNGYRYWMSYTPYPEGNDLKENPHIAVSNDLITWEEPEGFSNPLDEPEKAIHTKKYNSDSHIVYNDTFNRLECYWRYVDDVYNKVFLYRKYTTDGVNWSEKEVCAIGDPRSKKDYVSPAILYENGIYKMWYVDQNNILTYTTSKDGLYWENDTIIPIKYEEKVQTWHLDVICTEKGYEMIIVAYKNWKARNEMNLYYTSSTDGIHWEEAKVIIKPTTGTNNWDNRGIYRSSFIYLDGKYYVFYSGTSMDYHHGIGLMYGDDIYHLQSIDTNFKDVSEVKKLKEKI